MPKKYKMHKYEMDPIRTVGATQRTWDAGRTDGQTDGRRATNTPTPTPTPNNFVVCGVIIPLIPDIDIRTFDCKWSQTVKISASIEAHLCCSGSTLPRLAAVDAKLHKEIGLLTYQPRTTHLERIAKRVHQWPLLLTWFNFNPSMDK